MTAPDTTSILNNVAAYYSSKLKEHGSTPQGVDWNGVDSHERRHRQFMRLLEDHPKASILDLGCGFGDFLRFVRAQGHLGHFTGYDIAPAMIDKARELYGESDCLQWQVGAEPTTPADFAIASGILNVKADVPLDEWKTYVWNTVETLARFSRQGFAFNVLSLSSDPERRRPNLFYADPGEMLEHCLSRYGRSVALLQDYGLYEFTIVVRHTRTSS